MSVPTAIDTDCVISSPGLRFPVARFWAWAPTGERSADLGFDPGHERGVAQRPPADGQRFEDLVWLRFDARWRQ